MFNYLLKYCVFLVLCSEFVAAQLSDKRLCANPECTELVAEGVTKMSYAPPHNHPQLLSFKPNDKVKMYSRAAGSNKNLCGVEISGRRGYMPCEYFRELRKRKAAYYAVSTEPENVEPNRVDREEVKPVFDVIDGTTIRLDPTPTISPEQLATAVRDDANVLSDTQKVVETSKPESSLDVDAKVPETTPPLEPTVEEVASEHPGSYVNDMFHTVSELIKNTFDHQSEREVISGSEEKSTASYDLKTTAPDEHTTPNPANSNDNFDKIDSPTPETSSGKEDVKIEPVTNGNLTAEASSDENLTHKEPVVDSGKGNEVKEKDVETTQEIPSPNPRSNTEVVPPVTTPETTKTNSTKEADSDEPIKTADEQKEKSSEQVKSGDTSQPLKTDNGRKDESVHSGEAFEANSQNDSSQPFKTVDGEEEKSQDTNTEALKTDSVQEGKSEESKNVSSKPIENSEEFKGGVEEQEIAENKSENILPTVLNQTHNDELITSSSENQTIVNESENILPTVLNQTHTNERITSNSEDKALEVATTSEISPNTFANETVFSNKTGNSEPAPKVPDQFDNGLQKTNETSEGEETSTPETHELAETDEEAESEPGTSEATADDLSGNADSKMLPESTEGEQNSSSEKGEATLDPLASTILQPERNVNVLSDSSENTVVSAPSGDVRTGDAEHQEANQHDSFRKLLWGGSYDGRMDENPRHEEGLISKPNTDESSCSADSPSSECFLEKKPESDEASFSETNDGSFYELLDLPPLNYDVILVLLITAGTVLLYLWGHVYLQRSRKEGPLIAKINNLEKALLIARTENQHLQEKCSLAQDESQLQGNAASEELVAKFKNELQSAHAAKTALEIQVQGLEKELENSTEVGIELNRMLSDFLSSQGDSDSMLAGLQNQITEQQTNVAMYKESLSAKETEIHELHLELDINNSKVSDLQDELTKTVSTLLKVEEEKEQLQSETQSLNQHWESSKLEYTSELTRLTDETRDLKNRLEDATRQLQVKTNEHDLLKESVNNIGEGNKAAESLFDLASLRAELMQLQADKLDLTRRVQSECAERTECEKQAKVFGQEARVLREKYEEVDRDRLETQTKLEVLSNYFKDREAQLQKELSKQESLWMEKQDEASSTTERFKYMQQEIQNFKAQNESLKQEILAQEVGLKSQISVLEKKAHENWVSARQAERKLEDAKQEAAQLRNKLTLREREDKNQNRLQSPLDQNGDLSASPLHLADKSSPPPHLYGVRDHIPTSPPLPGLPPFLHHPHPGVPFMPPPLPGMPPPLQGMPPPFLPPPPHSMVPGDLRPPPLGRMSSPPLNSRYSPDSRAYSPHSRNSPSPTSDEEFGRSPPPMHRGYSPYNYDADDRREYNARLHRINNRNRGMRNSSGSASNDSMEKMNRHNSKV